MLRTAITILCALALGGAGAFLMFGSDKGLGIFLVLLAAILCRILFLRFVEPPPDGGNEL